MKDTFSGCHPFINFMYFCTVIAFSMFFMHPVLLVISVAGAFSYSIYLKGIRALKFNMAVLLPVMVLASLINPLFNHRGMTILCYVRDNPITLESIIYGLMSGMMLVCILLWFSCYNVVMTSDKFIYLFGKVIPALSLIFSMVLRFVPKFNAQVRIVSNAQKCIGRDISNGNFLDKAKNGIKIISIMVTWMLENAIDTADSMKSRGYGLTGRTAFSIFRFDNRDRIMLTILILIISIVLVGSAFGQTTLQYFPKIVIPGFTAFTICIYAAFFGLCFLPLILNIREDIKWKHLQLKI